MYIGEFLGTGAAEGIPAPFCRCEVCNEARRLGGKNIRLRSSFRLSEKIMVDLGADAVVQAMRCGDLTDIEHVLVTHSHDDHLNPHMLMEAMWSKNFRKTLHYYFTEDSFEIVKCWRESPWMLKGRVSQWEAEGIIAFHQLKFGEVYQIDDVKVTPFRGNHRGNVESYSALYLLELRDGRKLFYGLDSGAYLPDTIDNLRKVEIDIFISEATRGSLPTGSSNHLNLKGVHQLVEQLYCQGTLSDNSVVYLTHINHNTSHSQMVENTEQMHFSVPTIVAWDGLKILR